MLFNVTKMRGGTLRGAIFMCLLFGTQAMDLDKVSRPKATDIAPGVINDQCLRRALSGKGRRSKSNGNGKLALKRKTIIMLEEDGEHPPLPPNAPPGICVSGLPITPSHSRRTKSLRLIRAKSSTKSLMSMSTTRDESPMMLSPAAERPKSAKTARKSIGARMVNLLTGKKKGKKKAAAEVQHDGADLFIPSNHGVGQIRTRPSIIGAQPASMSPSQPLDNAEDFYRSRSGGRGCRIHYIDGQQPTEETCPYYGKHAPWRTGAMVTARQLQAVDAKPSPPVAPSYHVRKPGRMLKFDRRNQNEVNSQRADRDEPSSSPESDATDPDHENRPSKTLRHRYFEQKRLKSAKKAKKEKKKKDKRRKDKKRAKSAKRSRRFGRHRGRLHTAARGIAGWC